MRLRHKKWLFRVSPDFRHVVWVLGVYVDGIWEEVSGHINHISSCLERVMGSGNQREGGRIFRNSG